MKPQDALYRLRLAQGFLEESRQDTVTGRWRSAVDNAQLSVENAAKAVLGLVAPIGRTHNPAPLLRQALQKSMFPQECTSTVQRLAECAEELDFDVHMQTDYGDEMGGLTPWELFDEDDARTALGVASDAVNSAKEVIHLVIK